MAGRKRKADASQSSSSQNVVSGESSNQTVARSTVKSTAARGGRGKAAATQIQADGSGSSNTTNPSETASQEESTSTQALKAPRAKRQKVSHSTEVLQPTRVSARLKSRAQTPAPEMPPKLSPQSSTEPAEVSKNTDIETILEQNENIHAPEQTLAGSSSDQISRLTPKSNDAEAITKSDEQLAPMTTRGRKRKLAESARQVSTNVAKKMKVDDSATNTLTISETTTVEFSTDITDDANAPKIEEKTTEPTAVTLTAESASSSEKVQNVQDTETANQSTNGTTLTKNAAFETASQPVNKSAQTNHTEEVDTGSGQNGTASGSGTRGRGKGGRGKGKGKGKGKGSGTNGKKAGGAAAGSGKGRGGGRGGGKGGRRTDDDSEVDAERPGPPNPYAQKLIDRQKELKQNFKRLAAAQKLLLNELAGRTQQTLARDKTAHLNTDEYDEVQEALDIYLQRRLDILENEHRLRIEQANRLLEAEIKVIQDRYEANATNIQDELFYAARGEYMQLVEGVQHAGDDEHTEPDLDGPGPEPSNATAEQPNDTIYEYEPFYLDDPKFTRGYNSRFVRDNSGAELYERGKHGWDDFKQRAKLNEISQEESDLDSIRLLLQASREALASEDGRPSPAGTASSEALFALADAASTAQPVSSRPSLPPPLQSTSDQQHLPSFMLPQAAPINRSSLPPSRGFPDYYTMGPRMNQLPPPSSIGLDDYSTRDGPLARLGMNQRRSSNIQYHPFPPPQPLPRSTSRTAAPPPYYYPNSNSQQNPYQSGPSPSQSSQNPYQSGPTPSHQSSSTARRPF
ncbi:hypothetical protein DPV78_000909 [Talaromyces pinophilus]|nr:hypothetical protein DPV78_000909 [Talaromyces pinophilus]